MGKIKAIFNSTLFWGAWLIIPLLMEIVPAIRSIFVLLRRHIRLRIKKPQPTIYPEITIIVPIYNSAETLETCLASLVNSTYPRKMMRVLLVNNESPDESFRIYTRCQEKFPDLSMQWLNARQGKSRALNLALYNSEGKYIINIDSDGEIEPHALQNLVDRFENNLELNCVTGVILTQPKKIRQQKFGLLRLVQELEFVEYAQAFLAGRSYASETNTVYTLSGAFSAFRKSAVLKSRLYNTDTICEDTQLTFQMRYLFQERVEVCEDAIFYTDPIESLNKLYTQRQRWQRGSLEVAKLFSDNGGMSLSRATKDVNVRTLLYDHTFAFPRMIWYLALLCMVCMNYSSSAILVSGAALIGMYIFVGYCYFFSAQALLKIAPGVRKYYLQHWWAVALLPLFNMALFFVRMAGIINSALTDSTWKTKDLTQERKELDEVLKSDGEKLARVGRKVRACLDRKDAKEPKPASQLSVTWYLVSGLLLVLGAALLFTTRWVSKTYGIGLNELLSTLTGNLQGTSKDVVIAVIKGCVLPVVAALAVYCAFVVLDRRWCRRRAEGKKRPGTALSRRLPQMCALLLAVSVLYANVKFDALGYFVQKNSSSGIYEDYYVAPQDVEIRDNGAKNLIYIYLESMETTYASWADGGRQDVNYIPNLTRLAEENVSFSNSGGLGGYHTVTGAGYTMAALFSTTTGVPYALPVDSTAIADTGSFATGIMGLGDVLHERGYRQEFLCGSDAEFGGRKLYFQSHGGYEIFDLFTAREKGYIPEDYFVWWGYEDEKLFDIARDEATRLSEGEEPFNLTLLTVDLHHIAGYECGRCGNAYGTTTANVAACTDAQVAEFVEWCKAQPFYEDTVIVITGDHPRMDTYLVDGVSYYDRTVYNCILNSSVTPERTKNREYTHMDIFPTVLSAMGFEIEGDRLGLGTNLFSDQDTLAEKLGFEYINTEVSKSSDYYLKTFAPELFTETDGG